MIPLNLRCPNCGKGILIQELFWNAGISCIKYICLNCGYDSSKVKTRQDNKSGCIRKGKDH